MKINIKETRFDKLFIDFVHKHLNIIFFVVVTILAIISRNHFRSLISFDITKYFEPWVAHLKTHGGFLGIPTLKADYTVSYQYILAFISYLPGSTVAKIKLVSWIFDFLAAIFAGLLVSKLTNRPKLSIIPILAYTATLFAPTIFANSALWGQCDIIYSSLVLVSLYLFTNEHYGWSFVFYGIALSFKLQALFMLPLFIVLYFKTRKFSLLHFLVIPVVYLIIYLPALFLGKPFSDIFQAYSIQTSSYPSMVLNFPNIYVLFPDDYALFATPAILFTFILIGCITYLVLRKKSLSLKNSDLIELGMIFVIICVYFLPAMHDRYMFLADLLAVVYLCIKPNRFYIPVLIWFASFVTYFPFIFITEPLVDFKMVSFVLLGVLLFMVYDFFKPFLKDDQIAGKL